MKLHTIRFSLLLTTYLIVGLSEETQAQDFTAPSVPTNIAFTIQSNGVRLSWTPNTENDLVGYVVTRVESANVTRLTNPIVPDAQFVDAQALPGLLYSYSVQAVDNDGNLSDFAPPISVLVPPGSIAVEPVVGISATTFSGAATLRWASYPFAIGYRVYRSDDGSVPSLVGSQPASVTYFQDKSTISNIAHTYYVRAVIPDFTETPDSVPVSITVGNPKSVLFVDSDHQSDSDALYVQALETAAPDQYDVLHTAIHNQPSINVLDQYTTVIWHAGENKYPSITPEDQSSLRVFIANGGAALIQSRYLLSGDYREEVDFTTGRLRTGAFAENDLGIVPPFSPPVPLNYTAAGAAGGPDYTGLSLELVNNLLPSIEREPYFLFEVAQPSVGLLSEASGSFQGQYSALFRDNPSPGGGRIIYWNFGLEDLTQPSLAASATDLVARSLDYLNGADAVLWSMPVNGQVDVPLNSAIDIRLRTPIDAATVASGVTLRDSSGSTLATTVEFETTENLIRVLPNSLNPNTDYTVRLDANVQNIYGEAIAPLTLTFTTGSSSDSDAPSAPNSLAFDIAGTENGVVILDLPDTQSDEAILLDRRAHGSSTWNRVAGPVRARYFADISAQTDVLYDYTIRTVDQARNESAQSPTITVRSKDTRPPKLAVTTPSVPFELFYRSNATSLDLSGEVDDVAAQISVDDSNASLNGNLWSVAGFALSEEGENFLSITAVDQAGNKTTKDLSVFRDTSAKKPEPVRVVPRSQTVNSITWGFSGEFDLVEHVIERRDASSTVGFQEVGRVVAPALFFDDQVTSGINCYRVKSVDDLGNNSPYSDEVCPGGFGGSVAGLTAGTSRDISTGRDSIPASPAPNIAITQAPENGVLYDTGNFASGGPEGFTYIGPRSGQGRPSRWLSIVNYNGFGENGTITYRYPSGVTIDPATFPVGSQPSFQAWGTYDLTAPGEIPRSPHWDTTRTLDEINIRTTVTSSSPSEVTFSFQTFTHPIGTDPVTGGTIQSDRATLKGLHFLFSLPLPNDHIYNWNDVENPFIPVEIEINGNVYEYDLVYVLDLDPNRRLSLMEPIDEAGGQVNLLTGDYSFKVSMFEGEGIGLNIDGSLTYSSSRAIFDRSALRKLNHEAYTYAPLGPGWRYPYGLRVLLHKKKKWRSGQVVEEEPVSLLLVGPGGEHYYFEVQDISANPVNVEGRVFSQAFVIRQHERVGELESPVIYSDSNGFYLMEAFPETYGFLRYEFDSNGQLTRVVPHGGYRPIEISYTGNTQEVTDSSGRVTIFAHNADGNIERVEDPAGGIWDFSYSGKALSSVRERDTGYGWAFSYDSATGLLIERELPHGFTISAEYETRPFASSERFYWGSLVATEWKDIPNTRREIRYRVGAGENAAHPDRVSITTPSGRNTFHYDLDVASLAGRFSQGGAATFLAFRNAVAEVLIFDEEEGNPSNIRFLGRREANTGLHMRRIEDAHGHEISFLGTRGTSSGDVYNTINEVFYPDGYTDVVYNNAQALPVTGTMKSLNMHISRAGARTYFRYEFPRTRLERLKNTYPDGEDPMDPNAKSITYEYESDARPMTITDLNGYVTRMFYHSAPNAGKVHTEVRCFGEIGDFSVTTRNPFRWSRTYDDLGRLSTETDPDGFTTSYFYDKAGRLELVEGPKHVISTINVPIIAYEYDGDLVTAIRRQPGTSDELKEINSYDARGNLIEKIFPGSSSDGSPRKHTLEYDSDNNLRFYRWNSSAGLSTAEYIYDNRKNLTEAISPEGERTEYDFDEANELSEIRQIGTNNPTRTWTIIDRDEMDRPREILLPEVTQGGRTERPKLEYRYNGNGQETEVKYSFGGDRRLANFFYDRQGKLYRQEVEMDGGQKIYLSSAIQEFGRRTQVKGLQLDPSSPVGAIVPQPNRTRPTVANFVTDCFGNVRQITDLSHDERRKLNYSLSGQLKSAAEPDHTQNHTTSPTNAGPEQLSLTLGPLGLPRDFQDVFGNTTSNTIDVYGRELRLQMENGLSWHSAYGGAEIPNEIWLESGTSTQVARATIEFDEAGNPTTINGPGEKGTFRTLEYDRSGKLRKIIDDTSNETTFEYNEFGELYRKTFANGKALQYERDNLGRVTSVLEIHSGTIRKTTNWEYDLLGRLSVIDDGFYRSVSSFDKIGRITTKEMTFVQNNLTETLTYTWGQYGNLVSVEDSDGYKLLYTWDNEDNLINIDVTASGLVQSVERNYDRVGQLHSWEFKTNNSTITTANVAYDSKGRVSQYEVATPDSEGFQANYSYDLHDRISYADFDGGELSARYRYDQRGFLTDETWHDQRGELISQEQIRYDSAGNRVQRKSGNIVTRYLYNASGQLVTIKRQDLTKVPFSQITATADSQFSQDFEVEYAIDGRNPDSDLPNTGWRSEETDTEHWVELDLGAIRAVSVVDVSFPRIRGGIDKFFIESRDPGTGILERVKPSFVYYGGRRSAEMVTTHNHTVRLVFTPPIRAQQIRVVIPRGGTGFSLMSGQQELDVVINEICVYEPSTGDIIQQFDDAGLLVGGGQFTYEYDAEGRLTKLEGPGVDRQWMIGPNGHIAAEIDNIAGETRYFFTNGPNIFSEFASNSTSPGAPAIPKIKHFSGLGADTHLGFVTVDDSGQETFQWQLREGPGTVTQVRGADGQLLDQMRTNAWGEVQEAPTTSTENPYGFAGRRKLPNGLYYNRARVYDSNTGRFTTPDPIGYTSGANPYQYASNDPVNNIDPMGFASIKSRAEAFAGVWYGVGRVIYHTGEGAGTIVVGGAAKLLGASRRGYFQDAIRKHDKMIEGLSDLGGYLLATGDPTIFITMPLNSFENSIAAGDSFEAGKVFGETIFNAMIMAEGAAYSIGRLIPRVMPRGRIPRGQSKPPCVPGSFPSGTTVLTPNGHRPIEELSIGDIVLARDPLTGKTLSRPIIDVHQRRSTELARVTLKDSNGRIEDITATPTHLFWVQNEGWVTATDLQEGDILFQHGGKFLEVVGSETSRSDRDVYNVTVMDFPTFFAGSEEVWTHNVTPCQLGEMYRLLKNMRGDLRRTFRHAGIDSNAGTIAIARVTFRTIDGGFVTEHFAAFSNMRLLNQIGATQRLINRFKLPKRSTINNKPKGRAPAHVESGGGRLYNHAEPKLLDYLVEHVNFDDIHNIALLIERAPCTTSCGPRVLPSFLNGRITQASGATTPLQGLHGKFLSIKHLAKRPEIYYLDDPMKRTIWVHEY